MHFPGVFTDRIRRQLGAEAQQLLEALHEPAPVSIRLNPSKPAVVPWTKEPIPWSEHGYYLHQRPSFTADPLFHAGCYYVQEASSQFISEAVKQCVDLSQSLKVLDLCASPGGKSTLLASLVSPVSMILANETVRGRAAVLYENMVKWGYPNTWVSANDPSAFGVFPAFFDLVLVDAPCSGEGMFRKDSRAVSEWSAEHVNHCSLRQKRILNDVLPVLKPGGILVYSTCTFADEENEDQAETLVDSGHFESVQLKVPEKWGITETCKSRAYGYRLYPHKLKGEGQFVAVLRRISDEKSAAARKLKFPDEPPAAEKQAFSRLLAEPEHYYYYKHKEAVKAIPVLHREDHALLASGLQLFKAGVTLGEPGSKELIPDHELALCTAVNGSVEAIDVDLETALLYLRRQALPAKPGYGSGWKLIRYKGHNLGWGKALPNRVNNAYPKGWRILKETDELLYI